MQVNKICAFLKKQVTATAIGGKTYKDLLNQLPKWVFAELIDEELKHRATEAGQCEEQALGQWLEANAETQTSFILQEVKGYEDNLQKLPAIYARLKARLESH